jgi:hypothetical protein
VVVVVLVVVVLPHGSLETGLSMSILVDLVRPYFPFIVSLDGRTKKYPGWDESPKFHCVLSRAYRLSPFMSCHDLFGPYVSQLVLYI